MKRHILVILILSAFIHAALYMHYGVRPFEDSIYYEREAIFLLQHGTLNDADYFYLLPISILAFFLALTGSGLFFVLFQIIISGAACVLLYYASSRLFKTYIAGFFSVLIFLLWVDNLHWNLTVMTESLFCSLIILLIYQLVGYDGKIKSLLAVLTSCAMLLITRPTGVAVVSGVVVYFFFYYGDALSRRRFAKILLVTSGITVSILTVYLVLNTYDFADQYQKGNIITYADLAGDFTSYKTLIKLDTSDIVVPHQGNNVTKFLSFIAMNPIFFLKGMALKIFYLVTGVRPYYSIIHNAFIVCWMTFIYVLFYLGLRACTFKPIAWFSLCVIITNCLLIGLTSVDWDNRFFIPMEPVIVLFAGGGASKLMNRLPNYSKLFL